MEGKGAHCRQKKLTQSRRKQDELWANEKIESFMTKCEAEGRWGREEQICKTLGELTESLALRQHPNRKVVKNFKNGVTG